MDAHSNRVTNKRKLEDEDDAAPAGENGGNSPGVRNDACRTQTIEVDYGVFDGEAGGSTKLEIWVTDIQGVESRVGEIWDVESYERAGKVKAIAKKRGISERASSTPMDKFEGEDWETARRELEGRQEEKAHQEEAADQEDRTHQQDKAHQEEKKAQQEENRVLRGGRKAHQEKKALREEKKAQREVKKAVVEKNKAFREKQKAADDLQTRKQKKIKAHPEKKARKEKRGIRENEKALQKKKKILRDKQKALRESRNALHDKKKTRQSMSTERLRSG
ncbi:uncharacterized protein CLUP02_03168 [Colletotrichum lupini]|uniref:Uncharacterized protein n=1 Tax=Colletotrichum lupini TaxID=145971 RepID=A0A9Q8SHV7_9PEZI|nr:uncharacterized protein CLUP02_03168 [Colletotrichum lupini]UQC77697.1 hypothetical protein CLUP02_03168 [Colletotrichum lupini]